MSTIGRQRRPVCARCGARPDARRGAAPFCLSCGHPLAPAGPPSSRGAGGGSGGTVLLVGCLVVFALGALVAGGIALFFARAPAAPVSVVTAPSAAPPTLAEVPVPEDASVLDAALDAEADAEPKKPLPLTDAERNQLEGNYTCSMDDTPAFPCRVSNGVLEKLSGSQRFKGPIRKLPSGDLAFSGTFFCPFGDCTHPVSTTFVRQGPGRYVGRFPPSNAPGAGPGKERVVLVKVR